MHPVVFSREWFDRHQRVLLWLLNAPVLGRWFRWVLCIRPHDVGHRRAISRLYPHAYEVSNDDGTVTADFRTHAKYAKRLYYAFRPVWWALHWWDQFVANPFVPALNAGFDTLTAYPDPDPEVATVDGWLARDGQDDPWATIIAGAGVSVLDSVNSQNIVTFRSFSTVNGWNDLVRSIFLFDTRLIGGNVVTAATLSIYGNGSADALGVAPNIDIYTASPASNTSLAASDFSNVGNVSQTGAPIAYASWASAYNDFVFNSTGIGNIAGQGISKFSARNANYDVAGVAPTWSSLLRSNLAGFFSDQTGSSNDPKLVVTFTESKLLPRNNLRPRVFAPGRAR